MPHSVISSTKHAWRHLDLNGVNLGEREATKKAQRQCEMETLRRQKWNLKRQMKAASEYKKE